MSSPHVTIPGDIQASVDAVCAWLAERERESLAAGYVEATADDDPQHHDLAAEWAQKILDSSGRDGWSACNLCRS